MEKSQANPQTATTTTTTARPERVEKGEYCIDHDIDYQEGDEFKTINNVGSVEACRQQCLSESRCEFYVWKGFSSQKTCSLKASSLWLPTYESGTVSGKSIAQKIVLKNCHEIVFFFQSRINYT